VINLPAVVLVLDAASVVLTLLLRRNAAQTSSPLCLFAYPPSLELTLGRDGLHGCGVHFLGCAF
jgi:hypothetical protein